MSVIQRASAPAPRDQDNDQLKDSLQPQWQQLSEGKHSHSAVRHASPYSEPEQQSRLEAARAEYEMLAKKKAFADRVKKGVGRNWNEMIHIEK